jgi:biopolymer transport protein TolR
VLELRSDGTYAVNNVPVTLPGLDAKLHEVFDQRPVKLMFVKAAPNRKYREVVEAMDIARGAGVQVMSFTPADQAKAASR